MAPRTFRLIGTSSTISAVKPSRTTFGTGFCGVAEPPNAFAGRSAWDLTPPFFSAARSSSDGTIYGMLSKTIVKTLPCPTSLSTSILPPMALM